MRSGFTNAWLIGGIVLTVVSLIGLTMSIATLMSLQHTPKMLIAQLREQHATRLAAEGIPSEVVARFKDGSSISDSERARLSSGQLRAVEAAEQVVRNFAAATATAADVSAQRSRFGIGACIVMVLVGLAVSAKGFRSKRAASSRTPEAAA